MPFVVLFILKSGHFVCIELRYGGEVVVSGNERGSAKEIAVLSQTVSFGKLLGIRDDSLLVVTLEISVAQRCCRTFKGF